MDDGSTALIDDICERRNYIIRRASNLSKQSHIIAANIDQAVLMVTISHPETSTTFIDRFLASAEAYRIPVLILLNKTDLYDEADRKKLDDITGLYQSLDYPCLRLSAKEGSGIDDVRRHLENKISLLSGNSGVGKSTLLNALVPDAEVRTDDLLANVFPAGRRRTHRHPGNQGLRDLRHGAGGGVALLPRDIPDGAFLPLRELHSYARTRLCRIESAGGRRDSPKPICQLSVDAGRSRRRQVSARSWRIDKNA